MDALHAAPYVSSQVSPELIDKSKFFWSLRRGQLSPAHSIVKRMFILVLLVSAGAAGPSRWYLSILTPGICPQAPPAPAHAAACEAPLVPRGHPIVRISRPCGMCAPGTDSRHRSPGWHQCGSLGHCQEPPSRHTPCAALREPLAWRPEGGSPQARHIRPGAPASRLEWHTWLGETTQNPCCPRPPRER